MFEVELERRWPGQLDTDVPSSYKSNGHHATVNIRSVDYCDLIESVQK